MQKMYHFFLDDSNVLFLKFSFWNYCLNEPESVAIQVLGLTSL